MSPMNLIDKDKSYLVNEIRSMETRGRTLELEKAKLRAENEALKCNKCCPKCGVSNRFCRACGHDSGGDANC